MLPSDERRRWRSSNLLGPGKPKSETKPPIFAFLRALVLLMFGILIIQLVRMQVVHGEKYAQQAEINALREVQIPSSRGLIYDRNLQPLVQNSASFAAAVVPFDVPRKNKAAVYRIIQKITDVPVAEIEQKVKEGEARQGPYAPAVIKEDLDRETALKVKEMEPHAPGLKLLTEPARTYLGGPLLSHTLGYVGPIAPEEYEDLKAKGYLLQESVGQTGIESSYEGLLRGKPGKKLVEVDAAGRELKLLSERRPIDGSNLVLSIDLNLQNAVGEALSGVVGPGDKAAAAVMDVHTGELLALVSVPTFDNNIFSRPLSENELAALTDSPGKPLVNHALADRYAPGSTFKTVVGAAALQEGIATPSTVITSRGYITVTNEFDKNVSYIFPDYAALGALDFYGGLALSSDVYYYYLAGGKADEGFRGLGEEKLTRYARSFGLGEPTGVDLPGESPGLVPSADWKRKELQESWLLGDTYNLGIGQGYISATPLQMAAVASAIANGGDLLQPRLLKEIRDAHSNILDTAQPEMKRRVPVDAANLNIVKEGMRQSVTSGVAKNAALTGIQIAGKTGTAEFGERRPDGSHETHGWFMGFAPFDDPQIAVVVFVERGTGGDQASRAASQIFDAYFHPRAAQKPEVSQ